MKPRSLPYLLVLVCAFGQSDVSAQTTGSPDTHLLVEDALVEPRLQRVGGLSHNTVFSIAQDRHGYIWIGTSDGLNRYDGYGMVAHRAEPGDSTSLAGNTVRHLLVDAHDVLWVGTDGGLQRLDDRTGGFVRYPLLPDTTAVHRKIINGLIEDRRGDVMVAIYGGGVFRLDRENDGFVRIETGTDRFGAAGMNSRPDAVSERVAVTGLYEDARGILWISMDDGILHRIDREAGSIRRFELPEPWSRFRVLYSESPGRLWIRGRSDERALLDTRSGMMEHIQGLPDDVVLTAVHIGAHGERWIGTTTGLLRVDGSGDTVQSLKTERTDGVLQNSVNALFEDRAGTLWVGTLSGLFRIDPHAKRFAHLEHDPENENSLAGNTVMSITGTGYLLWIGTLGSGLGRYDRRSGGMTRIRHEPDRPNSLCSDLIWSLHADSSGRLWAGTDDGLCVHDPVSGRFRSVDLLDSGAPPVNVIRSDGKGRIWIGSNEGLFVLEDPSESAERVYPENGREVAPGMEFVQSLHVARDGSIWMGLHGGTLVRYDPDSGTVHTNRLSVSERLMLVSEGIWAIHENRDGSFWLGSDFGLTRFNPDSGDHQTYTASDGLPGSIVYGILEDDAGLLWASTNRGLVRFEPGAAVTGGGRIDTPPPRITPGGRFRTFSTGDGVRNEEFNRRAAYRGDDGTLYFGGLSGLTYFRPDDIGDNRFVPPVVLTRIERSSRGAVTTVRPEVLDRLELGPNDVAVSFEFAALSFTNPERNLYSWRLEGFDRSWTAPGTRRYARYTNLPPGKYLFRLRASNEDGVWNETGISLPLIVRPAFYQTWWFLIVVATSLFAVVVLAWRYRMARVVEMERMRLRIASDLHDDIGSNLSSIALLSDMVRSRGRIGSNERRQLVRISRSSRNMVDALRDIVWSIDPDADASRHLVSRMKDTAASLLTEVNWTFDQPTAGLEGRLDMVRRRHIYLLYKEALHNVVRHARAHTVHITLARDRSGIRLTVRDDGIGFDPRFERPGGGMASMRRRAKTLGAALEIDSRPGSGTTVRLTIPE